MPLANQKHEAFCHAIARGETPQAAYESVPGYKAVGESARVNAERLLRKATVRDRIDELTQQAVARNDVTVDRILEEWRRIAFSDLRQVMAWGTDDALKLKPSTEISDEAAAAIAEVSEEMTAQGFKYRVKLHNKLEALRFLAKYTGMDRGDVPDGETMRERLERLAENRTRGMSVKERIQAAMERNASARGSE